MFRRLPGACFSERYAQNDVVVNSDSDRRENV